MSILLTLGFFYYFLYAHIFIYSHFHVKYQIDAIVQDVTAQGSISNIDALNIRLEDQVCLLLPIIHDLFP